MTEAIAPPTLLPVPIILDCDPGHDDAFAIMLAAADPGIDLLAITTVSGNGPIDKVTDNARRVYTMAGLSRTLIAQGASEPLAGSAAAAATIHGESALDGAELPDPTVEVEPEPAVELMARLLEAAERPVTIVATAPLTNIALLLRDHPEVVNNIAAISIMGGSATRGNWSPYAEFNIWADPEAADVVFASGLPIRLIGLDVTHSALATPEIIERLAAQGTTLSRICVDLVLFFADAYRDVFGMPAPPLHDPLAVLAVIHPDWFEWQHTNVVVETVGTYTRGATVIDLHGVTGRPPNLVVATKLQVDKFWDLMLVSIAELGSAGPETPLS
jgi:purine nucleosidase/pyrimidine-specific ribonucleoside hydrolase